MRLGAAPAMLLLSLLAEGCARRVSSTVTELPRNATTREVSNALGAPDFEESQGAALRWTYLLEDDEESGGVVAIDFDFYGDGSSESRRRNPSAQERAVAAERERLRTAKRKARREANPQAQLAVTQSEDVAAPEAVNSNGLDQGSQPASDVKLTTSTGRQPLRAPRCRSDFDCGLNKKCNKGEREFEGFCSAVVDEFGTPQMRIPEPNSIDMGRGGTCQFDTDCPIGFSCTWQEGQVQMVDRGYCLKR